MRQNLLLFFIFFFFFGVLSKLSGTPNKEVSKERYETIVKEIDLNKTKKRLEQKVKKTKKQEKIDKQDQNFDISQPSNYFEGIGFVVITLIILGIIYAVFKNIEGRNDSKLQNDIDLDEIEDIEKVDLKSMFNNSVKQEDYRLALRLKFLVILQKLSSQQIIKWKPDKTNRTYSREIQNIDLQKDFASVVQIFEKIWYGLFEIDKRSFNVFNETFEKFLKKY